MRNSTYNARMWGKGWQVLQIFPSCSITNLWQHSFRLSPSPQQFGTVGRLTSAPQYFTIGQFYHHLKMISSTLPSLLAQQHWKSPREGECSLAYRQICINNFVKRWVQNGSWWFEFLKLHRVNMDKTKDDRLLNTRWTIRPQTHFQSS